MAAPKLPQPSIIPDTVDKAFLLFLSIYYLPKSATAAPHIVLPAPFRNIPIKNAINPIRAFFSPLIDVTRN